jgi:hypothetical protein
MRAYRFTVATVTWWFLLSWVTAQAPQPAPITVSLEAYLVTTVTQDDGTIVEEFTEAISAAPGDVIEYRLVATVHDAPVLAGTLSLVGPVPVETAYLRDTATDDETSGTLEVSLDGETFAVAPLFVTVTDAEGRDVEVEVDPSDYRALRWRVLRELAPGEALVLVYRVVVR